VPTLSASENEQWNGASIVSEEWESEPEKVPRTIPIGSFMITFLRILSFLLLGGEYCWKTILLKLY
jgi:hypothetical protein